MDAGCPKEFLVWIALDHSGLLGIAKAGDGKLLIKLVKSTKVADKVYDKVGNFGGGYTPRVLDPLHCYNPCKH